MINEITPKERLQYMKKVSRWNVPLSEYHIPCSSQYQDLLCFKFVSEYSLWTKLNEEFLKNTKTEQLENIYFGLEGLLTVPKDVTLEFIDEQIGKLKEMGETHPLVTFYQQMKADTENHYEEIVRVREKIARHLNELKFGKQGTK